MWGLDEGEGQGGSVAEVEYVSGAGGEGEVTMFDDVEAGFGGKRDAVVADGVYVLSLPYFSPSSLLIQRERERERKAH